MAGRSPFGRGLSRAPRHLIAVASVAALLLVVGVAVAVESPIGGGAGDRPEQPTGSGGAGEQSPAQTPDAPPGEPGRQETEAPPELRLPEPAGGERALELLGEELPEAARLNGMEPEELRELVLEDPTVRLGRTGRVFFVDEIPAAGPVAGEADVPAEPEPTALAATGALTLHSNPGAARTILLDFDGAQVSDTYWNSQKGVASAVHPGWDPAGDGPGFSSGELSQIRSVWARVAEDFAPFDVDVTTEDPGTAAIDRSSSTDQVYGTRVLVSASRQASEAICGSGCGGVAYLRAFAATSQHGKLQPAWVFPQSLANRTKLVAEAASHEAGHNLGLSHDGGTSGTYYAGQGLWAPIMGNGYGRPLVQWSRGTYPGATNREDDLSLIAAGGAPLRRDEAGDTAATAAAAPPAGTALITAPPDRDTYALGTCKGQVVATASPATISPDLDLAVELLDASGAVVMTADPPSTATSSDVATGLGATLVATVPEGAFHVRVSGVGTADTTTTGYDDYGSLGAYTLQVTGCGAPAPAEEPSTPAPGEPSTPATESPSTSPSATSASPTPSASPSASPTTTTTPTTSPTTSPTPRRPTAPAVRRVVGGRAGAPVTARVSWYPPRSAEPPVSTYRVRGERLSPAGRVVQRRTYTLPVPETRTSATLRLPRAGRWRFAVQAGNQVGFGPWSARSRAVRAR